MRPPRLGNINLRISILIIAIFANLNISILLPEASALSTPSLVTATVNSISGATMDVKISYSNDDTGIAGYQYSTDNGTTWKNCSNPDCSWSNSNNWLIIQKLSSENASMQTTDRYEVKIRPCSVAFSSCSIDNTSNAITAAGSYPAPNTYAATSITSVSATLNGNVYSYSSNITSIWFLISTASSVNGSGMLTSSTSNVTASPSTASANTATDTSGSSVSLNSATTYYFQVNATNTAGTTYGKLQSFTTLSTDATLASVSVKGSSASLGTSNATLASVTAGSVTITQVAANDTSNTGSYVTAFTKNFSGATTKVVKYASSGDTSGFDGATAYNNTDAITPGDFFIIRVTAEDRTTILYYRINITVSAPVIATSSTISTGASSPSVTVTGNGFKSGIATSDLTVDVGATGLTFSSVTYVSSTSITVSFTGTAAAGDITIQANTSAFSPVGSGASNTLTVTVEAGSATYSGSSLSESGLNDGSITDTLTITLVGNSFAQPDGTDLTARVTNVPRGLTAILTVGTSQSVATLSFSGNARSHSTAHNISNLTITFFSGDFTAGAIPSEANKSNVTISFSGVVTLSTTSVADAQKNQATLNATASETLSNAKFCFKTSSFASKDECDASGEDLSNTWAADGTTSLSKSVTGLEPSTTYYYIVHGVSANGGLVEGNVRSFKTLPNTQTRAATLLTSSTARFNATVTESLTNPRFCYKSTSFSTLAECQSGGTIASASTSGSLRGFSTTSRKTKARPTAGYLTVGISKSTQGSLISDVTYQLDVTSLDPSTNYYFILFGTITNNDGVDETVDGGVQNFTTLSAGSGGGGSGGGSGGSSSEPVVNPGPAINSISRTLVCFTGSELTISGSYFNDGRVTLDGTSVTIRDITGSTIKVSLPLSSVGRRTITVTTPHGSAVAYIEYVSVPKPVFEPIRIPYLAQGSSISLPFVASNATSYGLVGKLPSGLTMNPSTGEISGNSTENGIFVLTLTASNLCGETKQLVELDIDAPTPNAISHRINFLPGSCSIPDSAKASLETFLEKAKGLSPRNLIPEIYVSGGGKANDPNSPLADCRQEAICDFLLLEDLLGEVLSDVFTGAENRIEIIVYWPRPNDGL